MGGRFAPVLGIGLFVAVVFGATFISQFAGEAPPDQGDAASTERVPVQPLVLNRTELGPDPSSPEPALRYFDGVHETADREHPATFWMPNPNAAPVRVTVLGRSCISCSSARVGGIAPEAMADFVSRRNAGLPPVFLPSMLPVPDLGAAVAAAALAPHIRWHEFNFDVKGDASEVPPASADGLPGWCVLQLRVKIGAVGTKQLSVGVGLQTPTMPALMPVDFRVTMVGMNPFQLFPPSIDFGSIAVDGRPQSGEATYWSATRGLDELPPPVIGLSAADPFLEVAPPEPLTGAQLEQLSARLAGEAKGAPAPVKAGYRLRVTALRKPPAGAPVPPPDVGPFDREIGVTGPNGSSLRLNVKGAVVGVVDVVGGTDQLKFGRYNGRVGASKTVTLVSDAAGLELEPVPAEMKPANLKVELSPARVEEGRRFWTMKVVIPAESGFGPLPPDAAVVLKGAGGQRVRLPVQGTAGLN